MLTVHDFRADPDTYRFGLDDPRWPAFLDAHGFAVVGGLVPDAAPYEAGLWAIVEGLSGERLRRADPATVRRSASWPFMLHGGMIQYLGHSRLQWELRERCAPLFARLYGVDVGELASSFDGVCLMAGARRYEPRDLLSFVHTDQSPRRAGRWSVQGLVNLVDSGADAGGLVVVPGSHLAHAGFFAARGLRPADDWYRFSADEKADPVFRDPLKVCGRAGDMLLWDSRTFHCNTVPTAPVDRLCAYVCMLPASQVPPHVRARRRAALEGRRCSNHHPGDGFRLFPELPRFASAPERERLRRGLDRLQEGPLTPLQRRLACAA